jgi:hypothetical protein
MYAATRGDVKIIEASESIRYLSQKMVKDYLFLYKYPQKKSVKETLDRTLNVLTEDLRVIAATTKDAGTKDILEFLAYSKEQIKEIFEQKTNKENAALMLDYSETLLEGADAIADAHIYDFTEEEKMLMTTKNIEYLLERISKYYMAFNIGFNTHNNQEQLDGAIEHLKENIMKINEYKYTYEFQKNQLEMNIVWQETELYFKQSKVLFIPNLLLSSVSYLENIVAEIALYHSKNQ